MSISRVPKTKAHTQAKAPQPTLPGTPWILSSHLQDGNLLPVAQNPEGKWMSGPKAWGHLTAAESNGIHVGPQVCVILVEVQSVAFQAAPAFLPALVHQHVQVAWEGETSGVTS